MQLSVRKISRGIDIDNDGGTGITKINFWIHKAEVNRCHESIAPVHPSKLLVLLS